MNLIQSCFAYNGHDFSLVDEATAVQVAGSAIQLWNTHTGKKDFIWSKRNGYCMVTANYNTGLIAAAEYGLNPEVHIYRSKTKELAYSFKMDTTVKCIGMVFSRDGKYLLMIGGVPDFKISIFDVELNKKIVMPETKLPCKPEEFISAKFNPSNKNQFCILSQQVLYMFIIHQAYDVTENGDDQTLGDSFRLEQLEYRNNDNPEMTFSKFIWDPYNRVHICTDQPLMLQVCPATQKVENQLNLPSRPACCVMTQKHMLISLEEGIIQWFKLELPEVVLGEKDNSDRSLKVLEEIEQEFALNMTIGESDEPEYIAHMHYAKSFTQLIMATETGVLGRLEVEAEAINYDEDEEEQNTKEKKVLSQPFIELGRFHTMRITGIKELGDTTQLITISEDHYMSIWEATNQQMLSSVYQPAHPTACDVNEDGTAVFIGTAMGAFRIYDVQKRNEPRLVQQIRFFDDLIPIDCIQSSPDGKYVLVSSSQSTDIYILSQSADRGFVVIGYFRFEGYILSSCFNVVDGSCRVMVVLSNNLLAGAHVPIAQAKNRMNPIPQEDAQICYRKVDRGSYMVVANHTNGEIYVTGDDKILKKYEYPTDTFESIDFRKAPLAPVMEMNSHSIGTSCWAISKDFKQIATGGKDGTVILRHMNDIQNANEIKAHALFSGGVTSIAFSTTRSTLYTAGGDGSFMAWTVGGKPNPPQPITNPANLSDTLSGMPEIERVPGNQIKLYRSILQDEFEAEQEQAKETFRQQLMGELNQIKDKLIELLAENERVTDIERLERDEFVIDTLKRDKVEQEGENECEEIRKEAEKTVLRLELLRERVKQSTWDKMEVQQKAIKSIQSDTLIFNYPIRHRTKEENKVLNKVFNTRKMELLEMIGRRENQLKEALEESDFSESIEDYMMNRVGGKPIFEDDESIQEAAAEFAAKDAEKKAKRDKLEQSLNNQNNTNQQGKKQPILKITKGKLGTKTKKKDVDDEEAAARDKNKQQQREIRGMEEMYWKIRYELRDLEAMKEKLHQATAFDLMYEPFEMYPDVRKRNQIEIIKAIVFELKQDFNKEFNQLESFKEDQIHAIQEKNDMISELLFNLKQEEELFQPTFHILEDPENIFQNIESEIKVERYYTKEERAKQEEERRRIEEREAALKGDNVGQRGLKTMMGGTELNLKKEKNLIDQELIMEDWMNQPEDQMTDEERLKFKEFKQKEKEFKEKQRKAWEQDLKKIKAEIIEIQLRFEERLLSLFKKKLFIDVRILEQELYLIRLVIMLHDGKETRCDEKKYRAEMEKLNNQKTEKEELINTFKGFIQNLEAKLGDDQMIRDQEKELRKMFPPDKQIMSFVRNGKGKKTVLPGETNPREQELTANIVELDPFSGVDKNKVKEILKEEEEKEVYDYEKDNVAGLTEEDFDRLVQERHYRAEMEKDKEKLQTQITHLQEHINYLEEQYRDIDEQHEGQIAAQKKAADRIAKIRFNFETIVYMKQGQVEVPQLPVATDYKDACLISQEVIDYENTEIINRGESKVFLMNKISDFKTGLKRVSYQKKRLDLEIKDFEERAKDVQLYRVTKQTQEIIQGKHQKKDEEDKKRLENQIKQLEENAQKRIKTIQETRQKLNKEIKEKNLESAQLEAKARQLQNNVDQRKQIMSLKSNTMNDSDADPSKKIKEIAHKRKLLDIAKQQTEEIEVLRDELDRLRARTFPSFAHLHNKPGYPDEN